MLYVTGNESKLLKRINITECHRMMTPSLQHSDMTELIPLILYEEAEMPNESKGLEAMLDYSECLVDDAHQTMQRPF